MSGRKRPDKPEWYPGSERFADWSLDTVVPSDMNEMLADEPQPPDFDSSSDKELADWAEIMIEQAGPSPADIEAAEEWIGNPANHLRRSEREALLAAFDGSGVDRWAPVVAVLRRGAPSARMAEVLADLIEHGAMASRAQLSRKETEKSDERQLVLRRRAAVLELMLRSYPNASEPKVRRRATAVAAILTGRRRPAVSKMIGAEKEAPRRRLADLRREVEEWPCAADE